MSEASLNEKSTPDIFWEIKEDLGKIQTRIDDCWRMLKEIKRMEEKCQTKERKWGIKL